MKFEWNAAETEINEWYNMTEKLEADLAQLVVGNMSEDDVVLYTEDLIRALRPVENMLFLMCSSPASMCADERVDFIYTPTYLAATFLMTAFVRYEKVEAYTRTISAVLEATLGRGFRGAGYDEYDGLLNTLEIFSKGDTKRFITEFPWINQCFVKHFTETLLFVETKLCSGTIKEWNGADYIERGHKVISKYRIEGFPYSNEHKNSLHSTTKELENDVYDV